MDDQYLRTFSPETLREMRSASRSPNKRSAAGASRDNDNDNDNNTAVSAADVDSDIDGCLIPSPPVLPPAPTLVTPFKRFRADSLLSPFVKTTASALAVTAAAAQPHSRMTRRREATAFQSLADDRFAVVVKSVAACTTTATEPRDRNGVDSLSSTQNSSQDEPSSSTVGDTKTHECSPTDVAALCSELLVCSETLEDQMDALDVGSFLTWRPQAVDVTSSQQPLLRHRCKPRICFSDDVLSLQDVFSEQTQLLSDDDEDDANEHEDEEAEDADEHEADEPDPERPVLIAVAHFPLDGGCSCMGSDCDSDDLERTWQVFSPPPHVGFDPTCCAADLDDDDDDDFDSSSDEEEEEEDRDDSDAEPAFALHHPCSQCGCD